MNLLKQAEEDLKFTLEDKENGFGVEFEFIDEANELKENINCNCSDIGLLLDITSGATVSSRQVEITARIKTLKELGFGYPTNSWQVKYSNVNNEEFYFAIKEIRPDRTLGVYNFVLELLHKEKEEEKEAETKEEEAIND
ncbi:hypothetical protein [Brachyspira sp.]|uniref:hypothetical protein n=1 Tax=Brachyspira sp. TaxID=1977261 RepID=UPI003D7E3428